MAGREKEGRPASPGSMGFSELLAAAKAGSRRAAAVLYRRHASAVQARARARLTPPLRRWYDTGDLADEVFLDMLAELPRFEDRGEPAFRHWLYRKVEGKVRSARRRVFDRRGCRREETWGPEHEGALSATVDGSDPELRARLQRALDGLDEGTRRILVLRAQRRRLPLRRAGSRLVGDAWEARRRGAGRGRGRRKAGGALGGAYFPPDSVR